MDKRLIHFITAFLMFCAANAQAEEEQPYTFSPPGCEFSATLPSEPAISKRCPETAKAGCYDVAKYVKVYDYNATINFEFSCNLITEDVRAVAHDVLRHRIGLTYEAEAMNMSSDEIVSKILNKVEVP